MIYYDTRQQVAKATETTGEHEARDGLGLVYVDTYGVFVNFNDTRIQTHNLNQSHPCRFDFSVIYPLPAYSLLHIPFVFLGRTVREF